MREELVEAGKADMLEHADRHDAIETSSDVAIVLQPDIDAVGEARLRDAPPGRLELGLRQRDAGDTGAGDARQIERQTAEAAADVEHVLPGLDNQLGGDVAFLGQLRAFQRLPGMIEIGAGILQVRVQKKGEQPLVEIVVMRDVSPGAPPVVERRPLLERAAHPP